MKEKKEQKTCSKCQRVLPLTMFHRDSTKPDGFYPSCSDCRHDLMGYRKKADPEILGYYKGHPVVRTRHVYPMIGAVRAHRFIAEDRLGRKLLPWEHVHHLDHNKQNWSPDNLVVLTDSQHHTIHHRERRGFTLRCNRCGFERYVSPRYVTANYHGSVERMRRDFLCQPCYYASKRWLKTAG